MLGKIFTLKFVYEISTAGPKHFAAALELCLSVVQR